MRQGERVHRGEGRSSGRPTRGAGWAIAGFGGFLLVAVLAVVTLSSAALASVRQPTLSPTEATFTIPKSSSPETEWTLKLWSHGNLLGSDDGTTGVLVVAVPHTADCLFQADVTKSGVYYSGIRAVVPNCGAPTSSSTSTTTTTSSTTTTAPHTAPGHGGGGATTSTGPTGTAATRAVSSTATTPAAALSSQLAFTGAGQALWTASALAAVFMLVGATLLLAARPPRRRARHGVRRPLEPRHVDV